MRQHRPFSLATAVLAVALLTSAGCSSATEVRPAAAPSGEDVNRQDPASLREGGDLRLPLDALPDNFNQLQVGGGSVRTKQVLWALLPRVFDDGPDGRPQLNRDYVTSADAGGGTPQVVRYRINEKATWGNGRPVTWADFDAQVAAMNGSDPAFQTGSRTGYLDVAAVRRGATDKDVEVTFRRPFAEWQGLFKPLLPLETTRDPKVFNTGWVQRPLLTAGPFRVGTVDRTAKTIVLERDDAWWGRAPRLDRVIFRVLDSTALADELANGGIDWYPIGADVDLFERARGISGVEVRQATERQYGHLTLSGAPGRLLADRALRRAIARGIDADAVRTALTGRIAPDGARVGNHILPPGAPGYRDNSGLLPYDPAAARAELDRLGWRLDGDVRRREGTELRLRYVALATPVGDQVSRLVQRQLAAVGVRADVESYASSDFYADHLLTGNFDLIAFEWTNSATPFSHGRNVYQKPEGKDVGNNFGRIHDPRITSLYDRGLQQTDDAARARTADEIDRAVWEQVHHIPLYPGTGAYAVRSTLANFGARGLGDWNYLDAGFTR